MLFHDLEDNKVKKMTVTKKMWNEALKTFKHKQEHVDNKVIWKYISKNTVTQKHFK